jgi:hypothetical protein
MAEDKILIEIAVHNKAEQKSPKTTWDRIEKLTPTLSLVAIPVVIALLGNSFQKSLSDNEINKEYVFLAIKILTDNKALDNQTSEEKSLRTWAVDMINHSSAVKFGEDVKKELESGKVSFPSAKVWGYSIQIATVQNKDKAFEMKKVLVSKGFNNVFIKELMTNSNNIIYKVFVGQYPTESEADLVSRNIKSVLPGFNGFITSLSE